jgi:hypothetical protein
MLRGPRPTIAWDKVNEQGASGEEVLGRPLTFTQGNTRAVDEYGPQEVDLGTSAIGDLIERNLEGTGTQR